MKIQRLQFDDTNSINLHAFKTRVDRELSGADGDVTEEEKALLLQCEEALAEVDAATDKMVVCGRSAALLLKARGRLSLDLITHVMASAKDRS